MPRHTGYVGSGAFVKYLGKVAGEMGWRSAVEYPACAPHEVLINAAFVGRAVTILYPCDEVRLAPEVIADAKVTHPTVSSGDGRESVSDAYGWQAVVDRYNQALAPGPDAAAFSYGGEAAEQGQLVCEVRDADRLIDPLAGRRPPEHGRLGDGA
ncbi:hypothetical protein STAFG_8073 [Streptomyces afghaniensis 772]|uniref:Uncharacterized protein n=1 Tax=Streptomyces afghaniensis 772 TaxID=1283301 RepID=S4M6P9_9ACTN|nr:hypothetical protein STAFG_8073 [Streptomyces afghaniensis 772]